MSGNIYVTKANRKCDDELLWECGKFDWENVVGCKTLQQPNYVRGYHVRKRKNIALLMMHVLTNLHASTHTSSCFKKGNKCHNKMPQPPCMCSTKVHFNDENPLWYGGHGWVTRKNGYHLLQNLKVTHSMYSQTASPGTKQCSWL
jgi:hypothetical protein